MKEGMRKIEKKNAFKDIYIFAYFLFLMKIRYDT